MATVNFIKKLVVDFSPVNHKPYFKLLNFFFEEQISTRRINKKQYNNELDAAMKRIDSGNYLTQSEVETFFKNDLREIK